MFKIGQHIVCIREARVRPSYAARGWISPIKGKVYTVRSWFVGERTGKVWIRLEEIIAPIRADGSIEGGYAPRIFRPLTRLTPEMFNVHREDQPLGKLVPDHPEPLRG